MKLFKLQMQKRKSTLSVKSCHGLSFSQNVDCKTEFSWLNAYPG